MPKPVVPLLLPEMLVAGYLEQTKQISSYVMLPLAKSLPDGQIHNDVHLVIPAAALLPKLEHHDSLQLATLSLHKYHFSYRLRYFQDASQVAQKYAILSHRWEDDEVSHSDMTSRWDRLRLKRMKGWYKIQKCCEQALRDNLSYAWVDTCCIDKTSSAELQEAINSMFTWYAEAKVCYVFMSDVSDTSVGPIGSSLQARSGPASFKNSQWFTRGWTLQELLAPKDLDFYDCQWRLIGSRAQYKNIISQITSIEPEYLDGFDPAWTLNTQICIAQVMAWASGRKTTRVEDKAYSLLGIFGISLPMLYGEGRRAFNRLQEELVRTRDDQSIFAWKAPTEHGSMAIALTDSPDDFIRTPEGYRWISPSELPRRKPHVISSDGINLELLILPVKPGLYHAFLNAGLFNVGLSHLLTLEDPSDTSKDGTIIVMAVAFPVKEIGPDGHFVRFVPSQEGELIYYAESRREACKLRRVTLSSFLKRREYEQASEEDSMSFAIPETVSDLWCFSNVNEEVEAPQMWPWQEPRFQIVGGQKHSSITGLLTWNGWPHKLFWGYGILPISAIAFGYDFDFNPTCLIVAGRITFDAEGSQWLQQAMALDLQQDKKEIKINEHQKLTITGGTCELILFSRDVSSALSGGEECRGPPVILLVKTTSLSRWSGEGFHATVHLDNSEYDHYYRAKVHIRMNRKSKKLPWQIDVNVQREQLKVIDKALVPRLTRFVQPRPAYRLGTWSEQVAKVTSTSSSTSLNSS